MVLYGPRSGGRSRAGIRCCINWAGVREDRVGIGVGVGVSVGVMVGVGVGVARVGVARAG